MAPCEDCTHVLVTNGDNGYSPLYFTYTLQRPEDVIVTAFCHASTAYKPTPDLTLGQIDLGAVLFKKSVLRNGEKVFMTSLPIGARAKEVHDADYWFVRDAVDRGASLHVGDPILFYHVSAPLEERVAYPYQGPPKP